ncbi:MAG: YfcE family phosphodiesterase [Promethearchaeota archaeon]|jgi:putative phosphoesterase
MVRILCIGDSHIPNRAKELPEEIKRKLHDLSKEKLFDCTFFTGDIIEFPEIIDYLNSITEKDLFKVMGNMDYYYGNQESPTYENLDIIFEDTERLTVGLTHGAQISPRGDHLQLENLAIEKKFNILVSGHTHKEEIYLTNGHILLINPGSVTGAWSFVASGIPSFVELNVNKSTKEIIVNLIQNMKTSREIVVKTYNYVFQNNEIKPKM